MPQAGSHTVWARGGIDDLDDRLDQRAGSEVLAGAAFDIAGSAFEQALVDGALYVDAEGGPSLGADQAHEALEVRGFLHGGAGAGVDGADEAGCAAELVEDGGIGSGKLGAPERGQPLPAACLGQEAGQALLLDALIVEFQEQQVGDLLRVFAAADPGTVEDVGEVPDFGDEGGGGRVCGEVVHECAPARARARRSGLDCVASAWSRARRAAAGSSAGFCRTRRPEKAAWRMH